MKVSKTRLEQIIKEEVASLAEAPNLGPLDTIPNPEAAKKAYAARDKPAEEPATVPYGGKALTHRELDDPEHISMGNFSADVLWDVLSRYTKKQDIKLGDRLGQGVFGIVYEIEGPHGLSEALKITVEPTEFNAYKEIKNLKDTIKSRDKYVASVLPEVYEAVQIVSAPLVRDPTNRHPFYDLAQPVVGAPERPPLQEAPQEEGEPQTYRFFIIRMELLEKLPADIRSDVFGPAVYENVSKEARKRYINEYLSLDNLISALEALMGETRWERLQSYLRSTPSGRGKGVWYDIDKFMGTLRSAYLESEEHLFALNDVNKLLSEKLVKIFEQYIDDEEFVENTKIYFFKLLHDQLKANTKLPQYDPKYIKSTGLRARLLPPSRMATVVKNFHKRLEGLEKYATQYGDVHANNVMMRQNGDLVVADVGLFLFGPEGSRAHAATYVESLQRLCELADLMDEHGVPTTKKMGPVRPSALEKTQELHPVELEREIGRQRELEKYTEKDFLDMWRQWTRRKEKKKRRVKALDPALDPLTTRGIHRAVRGHSDEAG